ncbi:desulfoferrodoxin [Chloroflexota bacterium]
MASQLGKRYRCGVCGTEILCVKSGAGVVTCCGQEVEIQELKPIPSSD